MTPATSRARLAIQQPQPIGSERFLHQIEQMTGQRREARPRGRRYADKLVPVCARHSCKIAVLIHVEKTRRRLR
ncbi:MAG: hypothetical protein VBE63_23285 [Lamprobacter sp.]|uniref:hypothetical protein n=1 Tax=Lamprobacter sp. TaxID=3100796 RepID=UPI002B25A422|nr:hypothetical protein [Lamprobacter sp.]MEA3642839.1 hypothetical protein [Lamprobacter sp.]